MLSNCVDLLFSLQLLSVFGASPQNNKQFVKRQSTEVNTPAVIVNMDMAASTSSAVRRKKTTTMSEFPIKLYAMLELADSISEFAQAVTWLPHGRAFVILDKVKFMKDVVPLFFNQTKITSFSRQMHLWGFRRIGRGRGKQVWYHNNFLCGKPENLKFMVRTKIKGNPAISGESVIGPNFEDLPPLPTCDKLPSAVLNVMEDVILKLPISSDVDPTVPIPHLGNVTGGNNHAMVSQRTETESPFQFNMNCNQDKCLLPPPFHRAVSNEGQAMMTHCVPAMTKGYHSPPQVSSYEATPPLNIYETSVQELHQHYSEHYDMLYGNLNCDIDDDFEPLPFTFKDGNDDILCDDFATFIEGAIQQIATT